jgi:hypothetical protein
MQPAFLESLGYDTRRRREALSQKCTGARKQESVWLVAMGWHEELQRIVQSQSLVPSFEEWLDATGYRRYARSAGTGSINIQATAMNALYDYYQAEMRRRS